MFLSFLKNAKIKFMWAWERSGVWWCLMSSRSTMPFCSWKLARTAQVTVLLPEVSSTRCLRINIAWCKCRLLSGGRRQNSLFCRLCYVWRCEGDRDCLWDPGLSFGHPAPPILETSSSLLNSKSFVRSSLLELARARGQDLLSLGWGRINSQARYPALPFGQCLCVKSFP